MCVRRGSGRDKVTCEFCLAWWGVIEFGSRLGLEIKKANLLSDIQSHDLLSELGHL